MKSIRVNVKGEEFKFIKQEEGRKFVLFDFGKRDSYGEFVSEYKIFIDAACDGVSSDDYYNIYSKLPCDIVRYSYEQLMTLAEYEDLSEEFKKVLVKNKVLVPVKEKITFGRYSDDQIVDYFIDVASQFSDETKRNYSVFIKRYMRAVSIKDEDE